MPCSDLFIYLCITIGVILGNKIGARWIIVVSLAFKYVSYALLLYVPNYYVVLLAMCIFGAGTGLGNLTYIKNCWKYFPNKQGLVNGIILAGAGISSSALTPLADYWIINPNRASTDKSGIYPEDVADNLTTYLQILCVLFLILGILAIFLTFDYKEEGSKSEKEPLKNNDQKNNDSIPLLEVFFSKKNLMMIVFCFCGLGKYNNFFNI